MLPRATGNSQVLIVSILSANAVTRGQKMQLDDFFTVYTEKSKIIHYKHPDSNVINYPKCKLHDLLQQDEWFLSRTVCGINTSTSSPQPWFVCFPKNSIKNGKFCKRCKKILDNAGVK
jgi:hypothetical protein